MYEGFDAKERTVARKLVKALLAQGYELTVYDGGDDAVSYTHLTLPTILRV